MSKLDNPEQPALTSPPLTETTVDIRNEVIDNPPDDYSVDIIPPEQRAVYLAGGGGI